MKAFNCIGRTAAMLAVLIVGVSMGGQALAAEGWWNPDWQYRQRIGFDTTANGANVQTRLTGAPVLVRLHAGNFGFTDAMDGGEDLRFVSADDQTLLKHHIEKYDPIDEIAYVWVKVPSIPRNSSTEFVWMYFGNVEAQGGQHSAGTFDPNHIAVYHLAELEGAPQDSTGQANHAVSFRGGQGLPSVIGNGVTLSGAGDRLETAAAPSVNFTNGFTFSTWMRSQQPQDKAVIFAARGAGESGIFITMDGAAVCVTIAPSSGVPFTTADCVDIPLGNWHHLAVTAQSSGAVAVYLDGESRFEDSFKATLPKVTQNIDIGSLSDGSRPYIGDMDEIRVSGIPRPADWFRAAYAAQGADGSLVTMGTPEMGGGGGMPVFYLATILKNVTLDGWAVIGCLSLLAMLSWLVFLTKSAMMFLVEKENKLFKASFDNTPDPLVYSQNGDTYGNSTLFRIFSAGCETLGTCLEKNGASKENDATVACKAPEPLDTRALNAVKASLERGFIEESQRLNGWMVVLTMAITGGPFLGLLGTVWGVMNTFAAMAEAGEANIMAIAPGVASALSTTVIGLIVAIPALFGYNYLTGKIKGITAEMMIVVDQFTVNAEDIYGGAK